MTSAGTFEAIFEQEDPWGFETLWYEARKRDLLMAALPEARYARALEAGCATGMLTERLAPRCDALLAIDLAARAVERTRTRLAGHAHVEAYVAKLPEDWPGGSYDLIVLGELGYYFPPDDWIETARLAAAALAPHGTIVACHWLRPFAERRMATRHVHAAIARQPGLRRHVRHTEPDFLLEVWSRNAQSLRMREAGHDRRRGTRA
ncbi:class I SAM-dependent DNA methyltransferase [Cupriavidus basilensis]